MFIGHLLSCALLILGATNATPLKLPGVVSRAPTPARAWTNAERISRGLAPNKPSRLYDPSRVNAPHAKRSSLPDQVSTGNIAFAPPTSTTFEKKRDLTVAYAKVDAGGQLVLTWNVQEASLFGLPSFLDGVSVSRAFWIPSDAESTSEFLAQQAYSLFATFVNSILNLGTKYTSSQSVSEMFAPPSFPGDLATLLYPPGGGQAQRYIWVADENGQLHLAPDEATAQAQIPGAQVLLPVIVRPGAVPDFTAAQEQAAVAALGQPQRLWATSWFQDTEGYVEVDPNGGFSLASNDADATMFYAADTDPASEDRKLLTRVNSQTLTVSSDPASPLSPFSLGAGSPADFVGFRQYPGQNFVASVDLLNDADRLVVVDRQTQELSAATIPAFGSGQGIDRACVELVPIGGEPQYCAEFLSMIQDVTYGTLPTTVYVSTANGDVKGYLNTNVDGTFTVASSGGVMYGSQNRDGLWSKVGPNYLAHSAAIQGNNEGLGPIQALLPRADVTLPGVNYQLPDESGGLIRPPPNVGGNYDLTLKFFIDPATTEIYAFPDLAAAQTFNPDVEELCMERFPIGGSPGYCETYWPKDPNADPDAVQLYAVQISPASATPIRGWVTPTVNGPALSTETPATWFLRGTGESGKSLSALLDGTTQQLVTLAGIVSGPNFAQGQPQMAENAPSYFQRDWLAANSLDGGILTPNPVFNGQPAIWQWDYLPGQTIFIHPDMANAAKSNPNFVQVCIETVKVGSLPKGACES